jgi:hypothetical protein
MSGRDLMLRLALAILPLVAALAFAPSLARQFGAPGPFALVLAILAGGAVLLMIRSGRL